MATPSEIIERLGGKELLASRFGITRKAIEMWVLRGEIPRTRAVDLLLLAKERKAKLSLDELSTHNQRAA